MSCSFHLSCNLYRQCSSFQFYLPTSMANVAYGRYSSTCETECCPSRLSFLPFGPNTSPVRILRLCSFTGFNNLKTLNIKKYSTSLKTCSRSLSTKLTFAPRGRCIMAGVPRTFSSGVKQAELEADHSSPFRAELGNVWNYTTNLP